MRFKDKVAIVTGGGRGIGKAIALALAQEGAKVVILDKLESQLLDEVVKEAKTAGGQMIARGVDIRNEADVDAVVKEVLKEFGKIDILVNNAGIEVRAPAEEMTTEQWDSVMDTNLKAAFLLSRAVGRNMIENRSGRIINISSMGGHAAIPLMVSYSVSKAGILQLTKSLAVEWGKYNINVNSISPGVTETPMLSQLRIQDPEAFKAREQRIPTKKVAQPEDIANAVLFLASPEADSISGEDIGVCGAIMAIHPGYV